MAILRSPPNLSVVFACYLAGATLEQEGRPVKKNSYTPADLNEGFVVAITIEAREGEENAVAALIAGLVAPTLAESGRQALHSLPIADQPAAIFYLRAYVDEMDGGPSGNRALHSGHRGPCAARRSP